MNGVICAEITGVESNWFEFSAELVGIESQEVE